MTMQFNFPDDTEEPSNVMPILGEAYRLMPGEEPGSRLPPYKTAEVGAPIQITPTVFRNAQGNIVGLRFTRPDGESLLLII